DRTVQGRLGRVQGEQAGGALQGALPPPAAGAGPRGQEDPARYPRLRHSAREPPHRAPAGSRLRHRLSRTRGPGRRAAPRGPLSGLVGGPSQATLGVRAERLADRPLRQGLGGLRDRLSGRRFPLPSLPAALRL
ncbi:MAG: hypothetical protein AVDCRST_MAG22-557, partial [uncultured Rubrobacteraceae bacterium]